MNRDALVVGINQYPFLKDNPRSKARHLKTPALDAEAIAQRLQEYGGFRVRRLPETIQEGQRIIDSESVLDADTLEDAIVQLFNPVGNNVPETALLYFIGHGLRKERGGVTEGFLATSEVSPRKKQWGVSLRWLRELLQKSPVPQQIVWLDCCFAGELLNFTEEDLGTAGQGQTRFFIAAAREFELAEEDIEGQHGVFSRTLWEGLDPKRQPEGVVNNDKLIEYIDETLKGTPQQPIWYNPNSEIILTGQREEVLIPTADGICPYKGLRFFDVEDAAYFYGREALTEKLIERVQVGKGNFLAVLGVSGSGKSSLIRAGLIYQLQQERRLPGTEQWKIRIFTPGEQPLVSLATAFLDEEVTDIERAGQLRQAEKAIAEGATGLARLLRASKPPRTVLIVDQFEEVFTVCQRQTDRQQFISGLLGALKQTGDKLCLIFAMRDDFLGKCGAYRELADLIPANLVMVTPMTPQELRLAIVEPARKLGRKVEENLINTILKDLGVEVQSCLDGEQISEPEPGMLPLLEYTLEQLWQSQTLNWLKLDSYNQLGGVQKTLENLAEEAYKELSIEEQRIADQIFIKLTQLGEGTPDTRKQLPQGGLVAQPQSAALVEEVIQKLAQAKLIVTSEQRKGQEQVAVVDVAHETLIRYWSRLRKLLDNNREAIRTEQKIQTAAKEWRDKEKSKDYLLIGLRLGEAEKFLEDSGHIVPLSSLGSEFIDESRKERDRRAKEREERQQQELEQERKTRRGWQWLSVVLGLITTVFFGYPEVLRWIAIGQTKVASIPGGRATIGTNIPDVYDGETPEWHPEIPAFKIQKYEVSNRQYRLCVQARHCNKPCDPNRLNDDKFLDHPVVEVNAFDAAKYCEWLKMRLPTELEWEKAARGSEGRKWTWGDDETQVENFANVFFPGKKLKETVAVDSYTKDKTPEGVYHLVGNVMEWTASLFQISYYSYDREMVWRSSKKPVRSNLTVRGKSYQSSVDRITESLTYSPSESYEDIGFRCAK
ncbi:SUMF1/EgtB/PvdO family nonheme iron enzyme [Moorena producens JHB]|uniref:SUMF1/EgtB/PvdO family nonheme iron enzyme n=1 Tax=Moorena producens (strain JHB) TaxID=1454205 RepID=A0A1D9G5Y8_MOOP1|nr:SUMF1/EgtB/PvdO family nonheme iron enzyme [Moorena producens]AOY82944.1 SUMF1/EgtB/PvdO family nonheme iron enzyme [Moorena producens JHB]